MHKVVEVNEAGDAGRCTGCGPVKIRKRERAGKITWICNNSDKWSRRNLDQKNARYWRLKKKYGIAPEQYEKMYQEQGGCCKICKRHFEILQVDHSHQTGQVRGLLCGPCNTLIGMAQEKIGTLFAAIEYLKELVSVSSP